MKKRKLLLVVDYQKDFVDGSLGFEKAESLYEGIYNKITSYIDNGDDVIFTKDTHSVTYLNTREGRNLPIEHCIYGTDGHELYGDLEKFVKRENVIFKPSFGSMLDTSIHFNKYDEIEIVGVVTNICVISNAVVFQAFNPEADVIVDASLCASFNEELHEKALDVMEGMQVKVINRGKEQ